MFKLEDPIWDTLIGGYNTLYNPTEAIKKLEDCSCEKEEGELYLELWNELHHQGDLGVASYATVPQLIRVSLNNTPKTYNIFALITIIEIERTQNNNPLIPENIEQSYMESLRQIPKLIQDYSSKEWNEIDLTSCSAALAASKGHRTLAKAYLELGIDQAKDFLKNETGWEE